MTKNEKLLNKLVPEFYENKETMENYKKVVDKQNKEIKDLMGDMYSYETDGYRAVVSTSSRVSMDEAKLLQIIKKHNIDCVRTKEYVDMDMLENMLYHNEIPANVVKLISECKDEKEVKTLRVSKKS